MKQLFIMRGLPGSGKSTIAQLLLDGLHHRPSDGTRVGPATRLLSADDLRIVDGVYQFLPDLEPYLWEEFERLFHEAIKEQVESIIIDNTNLRPLHYEMYKQEAIEAGYIVHEIIVGDFDVEACFKRTIHEVPIDKIEDMKKAFRFPYERGMI